MIVLTVIGIITAILLPVAINSMPNENVIKFKKAHNTLYQVIHELVSSDKYFLGGDLGIRPDGTFIDGTHDGDKTYFCEAFADLLSVKSKYCYSGEYVELEFKAGGADENCARDYLLPRYRFMDIRTVDGIRYHSVGGPKFGYSLGGHRRYLPLELGKERFFLPVFCIDVDEIGKGEDPFGYFIRADGKIIPDVRAKEWLEKSIQDND